MNKITTIGLDLAKDTFHLVCCDKSGKIINRRMLRRAQLLRYFANLELCLIGMEACSGAHHWSRQFKAMGHQVKLLPPQFVKAYLRGNKNDYNDALAIAEAVVRPEMRFSATKTTDQQDIQVLHRLRAHRIGDRTALCNQLRGLLSEYGLVMPKGISTLRKGIPLLLEDADNNLSDFFRCLLSKTYEHFQTLDEQIDFYNQELKRYGQSNEACQRLQSIPGFGPVVASVFYSVIGNGSDFKRGRDVSASLGLVPRQHSSGGKEVLLGISKRGNSYLRSLLVHGARSVVIQAARKEDRLSRWINKLRAQRGINKATVALANKLARIGWVILARKTHYQVI